MLGKVYYMLLQKRQRSSRRSFLNAILLVVVITPLATGQSPPDSVPARSLGAAEKESATRGRQMRIWADRSGTYTTEAVLTKIDRERVSLRKADGEVIAVRIDQLCDTDKAYLKTEAEREAAGETPGSPGAASGATPAEEKQSRRDVRLDLSETMSYAQVTNPDGSQTIIPLGDVRSMESLDQQTLKASLQQVLSALRKNYAAQGLEGDVADALNPDRFDTEQQEHFFRELIALGATAMKFREKPSEDLARAMDANFEKLRKKKTMMTTGVAVLRQVYRGQATPMKPGDQAWNEHMDGLKKWHDWRPKSPTPLVLMGLADIDKAWEIRGTGLANTITEEMAAGFRKHLEKAKEHLQAAAKLTDEDPEIYRALIDVAKGLGGPRDEAYGYFAKGIECDPTYYHLYQAMTEYLLPRWHGVPGELPAFALMVSKNLGGEPGLIAYARVAETNCFYDPLEFTKYQLDRLAEAAPVLVRRFPHNADILGFACRSAYFGGDRDTARELLKTFGPDAPSALFGGIHEEVVLSLKPGWPQNQEEYLLWHDAQSGVGTIALNASGTKMVSTSPYRGCPVKLWNAVTRQPEGMASVVSGPAFDARFSSHDKYLAIARMNSQVELLGGEQSRALKFPKLFPKAVAFTPNEKTVVAWIGADLHAWSTSTGEEIWSADVEPPEGTGCVSPDGKWLLGQAREGAVLVDIRTGKTEHELPKFGQLIGFAGNDSVIGVQGDAIVQWTLGSEEVKTRVEGFQEKAIGYSAQHGLVVSALGPSEEAAKRGTALAHAVSLWSLAAGGRIARFLGHSGLIGSAAITPDRQFLITGSVDGTIRYWEIPATDQIMTDTVDNDSSSGGTAQHAAENPADEMGTFPDPNLEAAVRKALKRPTGELTPQVLETLTQLLAPRKGIRSLRGLEACTKLQDLHLSQNNVSDLSPLQSLPHLRSLDLSGNRISDIRPLAPIVTLEHLFLQENDINDISSLNGLRKLQALNLAENPVQDISALKELRDLHELMLMRCRISSVAPIATLVRLETLVLGENPIDDIAPLSKLVNLKVLNLSGTELDDLGPLSGLVKLTHLIVENNSIRDVTPIAGLPQLVQLQCSHNQIADLGPLVEGQGLGQGDFLYVRQNPLSEESLKAQIPALKARGVTVDCD